MLKARLEGVKVREVLHFLGHRGGAVPEELQSAVTRCTRLILEAARPRCVYRVFPVEASQLVGSGLRLEGADIRRHLEGCAEGVALAVTLGPDVETLLLRAQVLDMAQALVLDSVASSAVENVCDNLEADLRSAYAARGLYLTDRFSPGYGDLPLELQGPLCDALDTRRRIGLTVSGSGLLLPRKSVTAILGASPVPKKRRERPCEHCAFFAQRRCPGRCPMAEEAEEDAPFTGRP